MFSRKSRADKAVDHFADSAHGAVHTSADLLDEAIDKISPLVSAAADKATELVSQVGPFADQARDAAAQNLSQAGDRIAPLASNAKDLAKDRIAPAASQALAPAAAAAAAAKDQLTPRVQALLDAAQPKLDQAKNRAQEDLVPRLTQLLQQVADEHPSVADYSNRSQVALQALRGETTKYVSADVDDPDHSTLKTVAKLAAVGAVLAGVTVAVRQFLASKDDGWTAHQPSSAYTSKPAEQKPAEPVVVKDEAPITYTTVTTQTGDDKDVQDKDEQPKDVQDTNAHDTDSHVDTAQPVVDQQAAAPLVATTAAEAEEVMVDEGGPVADGGIAASPVLDDVTSTETAPAADSVNTDSANAASASDETPHDEEAELANAEPQYGEGWYMGDNPPADYLIKGNERSMKYHVPGSGGYERTIADVWFNSEDAAQQAGFTRAQR